MKKLLVGLAVLSAAAYASAETGTVTVSQANGVHNVMMVRASATASPAMMKAQAAQMLPQVLPRIATGDASIDVQIEALHKEMELKMKAVRDEYQVRLKALIGDRPISARLNTFASTTRNEVREVRQEMSAEAKPARLELMGDVQSRPFTDLVNKIRVYLSAPKSE